MKSTASAKGGTAYYNVSLGILETEAASALAMPDDLNLTDAPAMTDTLNFVQYTASDALASAFDGHAAIGDGDAWQTVARLA